MNTWMTFGISNKEDGGRGALKPVWDGGALLRAMALCIIAAFVLPACSSGGDTKTGNLDPAANTNANVKKNVRPQADEQAAVIETDFGRIVIELYPNVAPLMVERFKKLINAGFYNGTTFHRIEPNLGIIQGGDPFSRDNIPGNDGTGSSDEPNVTAEFSDVLYERGAVGAARAASFDSANCQFFITLKRQPAFDSKYTVFGWVIEGINNADIISTAPVEPGTERPSDRIPVKSISLQPRANFAKGPAS